MSEDPTEIRSLAVSAEDVVNAFVYARENPGTAVLRATPPFHGRMRGRIHVYRVDDAPETGAIHVDPADLLADRVVEAFPTLDEYEERIEEDLSPDEIRNERADALESWRERALEGLVDEVALHVDSGRRRVEVKRLE